MSDRYYACGMPKKPPAPSDLADKFMLRMPDGLRDRIRAHASANKRSMNSEIIYLLEFALDEVELEAHAYTETNEIKSVPGFLRDRIQRTKRMLESILADFEDPNSDIAKIYAERLADKEDDK